MAVKLSKEELQNKLNSASPEVKEAVQKILDEYKEGEQSSTFNDLLLADYREIPVDIDTFIDDDKYMGQAWKDSEGNSKLYPYWRKQLHKLFPDNLTISVNNFIATGSRGLGKSEICILIMCYILYRCMCLRNVVDYYNLKPSEKLVFAIMNIKLDLAEEVAQDKFQKSIQLSPWFMERGTVTGTKYKIWQPNEEYHIDIKIGSQSSDVLGLPVFFCLDGDTIIATDGGNKKIKDCVDKEIKVFSKDAAGNTILSDSCTVKPTIKTKEEYQIELENGDIIKCTANHRFMLKDGTYKEAQYLTEEDELLEYVPYGYIYKTTNIKNNKIYIGQHKSINFDTSYLGSGKALKSAFKKYGKDAFVVEFLEWGESKEELDEKEKYYIKYYDSTNKEVGYNIGIGGQGGDVGPVLRKKISNTLRGRRSSIYGRIMYHNDDGKTKYFAPNDQIPEGFIMGSCQHSTKNKKLISNGIIEYYINKGDPVPTGFKYGSKKTYNKVVLSKEEKKQISREHYIQSWTPERKNAQGIKYSGKNNPNYGGGCKGEKNGHAIYIYIYKGQDFECRKYLVDYLKENGFPNVSLNTIRKIEHNDYGVRTTKKFSEIINNLTWRPKNEN